MLARVIAEFGQYVHLLGRLQLHVLAKLQQLAHVAKLTT